MEEWKYHPARDLHVWGAARWRSLRREAGLVEFSAQQIWWSFIRAYLKLAHRLKIENPQLLPTHPPFVVVANHSSHLDALVLAATLPARSRRCVLPLAAGDTFFQRPASAAFAAWFLNALPLWRHNTGRHALHEMRQRLLDEPCGYILFPEGTRSRSGEMAPFKSGLGILVADTHVPVVPCHLSGAFTAWPATSSRPRWGVRITVRVGQPIHFDRVANHRTGWEEISHTVERAVRALALNLAEDPAD